MNNNATEMNDRAMIYSELLMDNNFIAKKQIMLVYKVVRSPFLVFNRKIRLVKNFYTP